MPLLVLSGTVAACSLVNSFSDLTPGDTGDAGTAPADTGAPQVLVDSGPFPTVDSSTDPDGSTSDSGSDAAADAAADSGDLTFCQRGNYKLCAQFENANLDNFFALFPVDANANGGTLTRDATVFYEGKGSLLASIPAGALGYAAARRTVTLSGYQALTVHFDIYPEKGPMATDSLSLFSLRYGNNTNGEYLSVALSTTGTSLAIGSDINGTSKGSANAGQLLAFGKWTRVMFASSISAAGTAVRLDLTPDGAATSTVINTTLTNATNSAVGTLVTVVAPGINHSNGNAGSPEYKYYFDNLAVDY